MSRRTSPRLAKKVAVEDEVKSVSVSAGSARVEEMALLVGDDLAHTVASCKLLVVGAGGIGCELLKTLVLSGFTDIHIVDLDTIDVSNLNRQFLFRKSHVGMSKSKVAAQAALKFLEDDVEEDVHNADDSPKKGRRTSPRKKEQPRAKQVKCKITDYQGNIMTSQFGVKFFLQFDLVLNALDNAEARRYVNRICISLNIPLVESGTGGYTGQVKPIVRGHTECFECDPSLSASKQKVYPVCTIRNSPDKPIHTIVWAKHVFNALFGPKENDSDNLMNELSLDLESFTKEKAVNFAIEFFNKHFNEDVATSAKVAERWVSRDPPVPLELDSVWNKDQDSERISDQSIGTVEDNAAMFFNAIIQIITTRSSDFGALTFDKDDRLALEFVSAAANLRMHNYGIPRLSLFDVKGIAGNIIHAIATTNAIAAGLMVVQALNILGKKFDDLRTTWITTAPPAVLAPEKIRPPNPNCAVCSVGHAVVTLDTNKWTLKKFFSDIIRGELELSQASVDVENRE
jgi:ubiquitin-like 1-activating enzyme E1 B